MEEESREIQLFIRVLFFQATKKGRRDRLSVDPSEEEKKERKKAGKPDVFYLSFSRGAVCACIPFICLSLAPRLPS